MKSADALEAILQAYERQQVAGTVSLTDVARTVLPGYHQRPHTDYLAEILTTAITNVEAGQDQRLIVEMPPGQGKSSLCSVALPLYALSRHPDWEVVTVSAEASLATKFSRDCRRAVTDGHIPGVQVADDSYAVTEWETTAGGSMIARGVGGQITGRRARCVSGDMLIESEYGTITAEEAYARKIQWIMAYDHITNRPVWRRVEAHQRTEGRTVVSVETEAGRILTCTADHPVYSGGRYTPAGSLGARDTLVVLDGANRMPLRDCLPVRCGHPAESNRTKPERVLLTNLFQREPGHHSHSLVPLRKTDTPGVEVLHTRMLHSGTGVTTPVKDMPRVQNSIPCTFDPNDVLQSRVREQCTFQKDDRQGELQIQDRNLIREMVPVDAPVDFGAGRRRVCCLPGQSCHIRYPVGETVDAFRAGSASHQRTASGQSGRESDNSLHRMSFASPQEQRDAVSVVRDGGAETHTVYDFQVEGTHNFFANGVLVHNCMIIDDPIKNLSEAHSRHQRDQLWDTWQSVLKTRLRPGSLVVLVQTRWHEDDLAGRLIATGEWNRISLPALAEHGDQIGRDVGQPLLSPQSDETPEQALTRYETTRREVGPYVWDALYQQRPSPPGGAVFNSDWWQTTPAPAVFDQLITSWDLTFGSQTGDYVVGQVWGRLGADCWLLDLVRGRWSFTDTLQQIENLASRWPDATAHLVEKAANGAAAIDTLTRKIPGVLAVKPTASKEIRALAVAPMVEAGNVHLPERASWLNDFHSELAGFPSSAPHDDIVDSLSQALDWLRQPRTGVVSTNQRTGGLASPTGFRGRSF